MAINFPSSLDTFTNPTPTDYLDSPSHSGQHSDANDAIEAMQVKLGIDDSAVITSVDYKLRTGWINILTIPTRASADDPTYVLTFAGIDLSAILTEGCPVTFTQNGATFYGWLNKDTVFSTNSTVSIYGGTDYDILDTATYPITDFKYGPPKQPGVGFPVQKNKWTVRLVDTTQRIQASPSANAWYNWFNIVGPIGNWDLDYKATGAIQKGSTGLLRFETTISTANNTESDSELTAKFRITANSQTSFLIHTMLGRRKNITLTSETPLYLNLRTEESGADFVRLENSEVPTTIDLVCGYL